MSKNSDFRYEITLTLNVSEIFFAKITEARTYIRFHCHESIEIIYVLSGSQKVLFPDSSSFTINENDCFLINSSKLHAIRATVDNTFILIQIPVAFLRKHIPNTDFLYYDIPVYDKDPKAQTKLLQFREILDKMYVLLSVKPDGYQLRFNSLVFEILFELYHNFSQEIPGINSKTPEKHKELLNKIIQFVYDNHSSPLHSEECASYCHLQHQYFCRFFKKHTGKTFLEFVNNVRLYYAYIDLIYLELPIYEISAKNGFTSYETFRKLFKKNFGCSPSEFRAMPKRQAEKIVFDNFTSDV